MVAKRVNPLGEENLDDQGYDPHLGLAIARTWWELGRWTNRLRSAGGKAERLAVAREWADEVNERGVRKLGLEVLPRDLSVFVEKLLPLLERKFDGGAIASEATKLVAPMRFTYEDRGRFLEVRETHAAFWAAEYYYLFGDLKRFETRTWLNVVGYCENEACKRFFIRQRIDNRFDSDRCRTNAANREYYKRHRRPQHGGVK